MIHFIQPLDGEGETEARSVYQLVDLVEVQEDDKLVLNLHQRVPGLHSSQMSRLAVSNPADRQPLTLPPASSESEAPVLGVRGSTEEEGEDHHHTTHYTPTASHGLCVV